MGAGANSLGKVWVLIVQLLSIPVLTSAWGVDGYGTWLMLTTIPTYLALSDFGLGTAAAIDITRSIARGDRDAALQAFQSVWVFLTVITGVVAILVGGGLALWIGFYEVSEGADIPAKDIALTAILIMISALFSMQMNIFKSVYQATHKYALGTFLYDLCFLVSGLAVVLVASVGAGIVNAAATAALITGFWMPAYALILKRFEPWWHPGTSHANRATLRQLLQPSLAAFALIIANSFGIQGVVLTIGWNFGPAAAAIFATARMITRIPLQFSGLLTRASLPELTHALTAGNDSLVRRLMKLNMRATLTLMIPATLALGLFGPELLGILSRGEMALSRTAFSLLALAALATSLWTVLGTALMAVNRQGEYAWLVLALYVAVALLPFLDSANMFGVLSAMVFADAIIAAKLFRSEAEK